jgi:integrase
MARNKDNLRNRYLKPAAEEAGASCVGLHTFRHTFASLHIARGTNVGAALAAARASLAGVHAWDVRAPAR